MVRSRQSGPPSASVAVDLQRWAEERAKAADLGADVAEDWRAVAAATSVFGNVENTTITAMATQ